MITKYYKYLGLTMHVFLTAFTKSRHELPFPKPSLGLLAKFRPKFNDIGGTDEPIIKLFVLN